MIDTETKRGNKLAKALAKSKDLSSRQSLLLAAKKLFARQGLSATSIRDIAAAAGVNSSLISYHFAGKEGLYRACLQEIGEARLQAARQILKPAESPEEFRLRLVMFLENMFELYLRDREAGLIIIREYDRVNSPAESIFKETFLKVYQAVVDFFRQGQKKGFVNPDRDTFLLASLFFGCLSSQMRLDPLKEKIFGRSIKDEKERKHLEDLILELFLK